MIPEGNFAVSEPMVYTSTGGSQWYLNQYHSQAMLRAFGVEIVERSGSRIGLRMGSERMVVHRPHPRPNAGRATVRDIALFLRAAGVEP